MPFTFSQGQVLNSRYRIAKELREGGFGAVYRAWNLRMNGPCALKESFDTSPAARQQFEFEAQVLFKLKHPNLPRVYDYFLEGGVIPCLVMDYVEGDTLTEKLQLQQGPLSEKDVLAWAKQICDALAYLHGQKPPVIHRDIKPENIKIDPNGRAILLDFGLAKAVISGIGTIPGARGATSGYSPVEQYGQISGGTDERSDVYALGATLYELLTGVTPPESIDRFTNDQIKLPRQLNSALGARTEQVLLKALAVQSKDRFQSMSDFQTALFAPSTLQPVQLPPVQTTMKPPQVSPPPVLAPKKAAPPLRVWITMGVGLLAGGAIIIGAINAAGTGRVGQTAIAIGSTPSGTTSLTPTVIDETPIPVPSAPLTASGTLMPTGTYTPTATAIPTTTNTSIPTPEPGATRVSEKDGMVLVYVPEGKFEMGSTKGSPDEVPAHTIYLDTYWIDRTEVTNGMYEQCVATGACDPPSKKAPSTRKDGYYGISKYDQ